MSKDEIKAGFRGIEEIIRDTGRSPFNDPFSGDLFKSPKTLSEVGWNRVSVVLIPTRSKLYFSLSVSLKFCPKLLLHTHEPGHCALLRSPLSQIHSS